MKKIKKQHVFLVLGCLALFVGVAPFLPKLFFSPEVPDLPEISDNIFEVSSSTELAVIPSSTTPYQIVIPKIGVDMPIVINENNAQKALNEGAWHIPGSGEPGTNSIYRNTVISAHRFLYTAGAQTFYHLDKLEDGDVIKIFWDGEMHEYKVYNQYIVKPEDVNILSNTTDRILTLFTCHPVFSTKERLVVRAHLVE